MNLFQSALRNFENLGIIPTQSRLNGKILMAFSAYWIDNTLNCIFLVREVNDFSEMANSIFITSATTTISTCFTILIINKAKLFRLANYAGGTIDRAIEMNPESREMYEMSIRQIEKWNGIIYFFITKISPLGLILPQMIVSIFTYFISDLGQDAFVLPTPTWFPFDWKNPIGYLGAVLLEFVMTVYMAVFLGSIVALAIAAFLFEVTMIRNIKNQSNSIDESSESHGDRLQIVKKLSNFIELHSMLKQNMHDFSALCQPFFLVLFTSGLILICVSLLLIQTALREMDFVVLLMAFFYVCVAFGMVLIACELAQRACDSFNNTDEAVVQWNWYLLPHEIQRMLPLVINVVQQPVYIECFGSITCSRDTFVKILNKAYSCFMMLRHFSK